MIKYKTSGSDKIIQVEVARETEKCVWTMESTFRGKEKMEVRHAKMSDYESFHDTWQAAKDHLISLANSRVIAARRQLESENGKLGNIKGMKPLSDSNA